MKKSINAWTFPDSYTFKDCLEAAKTAGFDAVEFNLDKDSSVSLHSFKLSTPDRVIGEVAETAKKLGVAIASVSSSLHGNIWTRCKAEDIAYAQSVLEKQLFIARMLGADGILVVPGGMADGILLSEARENSIKNLRAALPIIEKYGIKVGLENVWNGFFLSPYDMVSFIDEIGHPLVGAYFDLGNMVAFSESAFWADVLAGKVVKVHVKDFKRNNGRINSGGEFCQLCDGDVNFERVMPILKRGGFDGYITSEVFKGDLDMSDEDYFKLISKGEDKIIGYYENA